jgi:nucleoside-diphosphate-sugar epimerase
MDGPLVVTGGTGFIGARLVARLVGEGRAVRCLVRRSSRTDELRELGAELRVVELETGEGLDEALEGAAAVLHLAGAVRAWGPAGYARANVDATRTLAERARRAGVRRLVAVSSLAAAGPSPADRGRAEDEPPAPICDYGRSKLAGERALAEAAGGALETVVVRPGAVYGPGDRDFLALFRLVAGRTRLVPYAAPPGARLSMVHVDDVVELVLRALERAPAGAVYHGADGASYTWPEIIGAIGRALGRRARPLRLAPAVLAPAAAAAELLRPFRPRPPVLCLDKLRQARQVGWLGAVDRARAELGFEPRYALEEGMAQTACWYREQGWL